MTDGIIADFHGGHCCDAVDCVGERVLDVFLDIRGAGWRVVVPGFFGAVGFHEVEVLGRASCEGSESAPMNSNVSPYVQQFINPEFLHLKELNSHCSNSERSTIH